MRDAGVFLKQDNNTIFFGYGRGGYSKIGLIQFEGDKKWQYTSHNYYTDLVSEIGLVGLFLFLLFFITLLYIVLKIVKQGRLSFPFIYLLFYLFFYSLGGNPDLTDNFTYILYGIIISEYLLVKHTVNQDVNIYSIEKNLKPGNIIIEK